MGNLWPLSFLALSLTASSFGQAATSVQSNIVLAQQAFTTGLVHHVTLSGTAYWYSTGVEDSGPITLVASSDGTSNMTIQLGQSGERVESQNAIGAGMTCSWSSGGIAAVPTSSSNCWKPLVWFLPPITFQSGKAPSDFGLFDVGPMSSSCGAAVEALQAGLVFQEMPVGLARQAMPDTLTDLMVDAHTFRPVELDYTLHPDAGSPASILIRVAFAGYQTYSGVTVPTSIQRYLNGALQLDITVNEVTAN